MKNNLVIAIDGTSGSGKSTTARIVAERLGWFYLETGATYRAVAWKVLKEGKDPEKRKDVIEALDDLQLEIKNRDGKQITYVNGNDVTEELRMKDVSEAVTPVSKMKEVREWLVEFQRKIARGRNIIVEGRDIGTVVFPEADLKIFMDADIEERTERRYKQREFNSSLEEIQKDLKRRDFHDSTRKESPLKKAPDALVLDTTDLSIEEQVKWVIDRIKKLNEGKSFI